MRTDSPVQSSHKSGSPNDDDDDEITLPEDTLAILKEFLIEKEAREKLTDDAVAAATDDSDGKEPAKPSFKAFEENWQLSQFWYNDKTKEILANVCRRCIRQSSAPSFRIGLLSCPSLYDSIKVAHPDGVVNLFEYDDRFTAYGPEFVHYDYINASEPEYLQEFYGAFDLLIADPPFLSEECIEKIAIIIKNLSKLDTTKIILCSGQVVAVWADKYLNLRACVFQPEHERNLGNEFASYANFDLDEFIKNDLN